ncbi:hypothetical protein ALC60_01189 [Trachymyrmex zeteki]|uniref:Osiris 16 n=2 Tax=Mycetomoellerius zeteki TaxID=64791 RepID=A0A151XHB7_9HYME|nr:hypothetical protein ALC60_01189 [Trachymyrmex zeteki]
MKRPKGKKEKGLSVDSLYIYCKYPKVCPVHDTRLIRQLQGPSSSRISSRYWRSVDLGRKKITAPICSPVRLQGNIQKFIMKGITHVVQLSRCHLLLLVLFLSGCANAEIERRTTRQLVEDAPENLASNLNKDCGKSYSATCLKLDVVSFLDKLSEQENIGILPGVSVIKENGSADVPASDVVANLARDFPNDVEKRLDAYLVHKVGSYLNSHSISIKLFDPKTFEATRSFNEEALTQLGLGGNQNVETGRKKDKGGYGGLMAGLMMMKGTLGAIGFGALALLAGKALMTGLMALMLSAIIGLKSLASGGDKKTTYEIVSKPVYSSSHTHSSEEHHGHGYGHSGYGRSLDTVHDSLQQAVLKYGNAHDRRSLLQN